MTIFEIEIYVSSLRSLDTGNFTLEPDLWDGPFDGRLHFVGDLRDRIDPGLLVRASERTSVGLHVRTLTRFASLPKWDSIG